MLVPAALGAQEDLPPDTPSRFEIGAVAFEGNSFLSDGTLAGFIQSRESPSGISQFMHGTFWGAFGSPAEIFDPITLERDVDVLSDLYRTRGFYNASIGAGYTADTARRTVAIRFDVAEGPRSLIDTLIYAGIDSLTDELKAKIYGHALVKQGDPYEADVVSGEIVRVINFLQNSGYPSSRFDYETGGAFRYTSSNNFEIRLVFETGRLTRFGEITMTVEPPRADITDNLALRHLDFKPGDLYSRDLRITSERNLNRLDLFEAARVDQEAAPDSVAEPVIPIRITVKPQPRNELSPELIVSDENGALNLGLGVAYTNRNFFGDGRTFSARLQGRSQSIVQILQGTPLKDSAVIGSADLEFRLLQPYLFTRTVSGFWTSSIGVEKQSLYQLSIIRNRVGSSIQLSRTAVGLVEWTLERVSPDILVATDQPDTVIQLLRTEEKPQFNSIIAFTWQRDMTNGVLSPSEGYFHTVSLEESGILPKLLPGIRSGLPFTQYYKFSLLGRWYHDLSGERTRILAFKFRTGYQNKYGESRSSAVNIPLNRRFFSGGSNSVRGWKARKLGAMPTELLEFGGNFILEGGAEIRINHFHNQGRFMGLDLASIWGVYYVDVGNVWNDFGDFRPSALAVAAGVGFRYETLFGPFRVDFGMRVYDPGEEAGRRTIFDKKFFGETLARGVFHLGIGHAF
ncbi:MAG TPA: BamA/TamA family outer membrane protein [Bacteroidota bacterium]|nr:BamA/TamA family outer membrane protein [Bacteroidota bacterium]